MRCRTRLRSPVCCSRPKLWSPNFPKRKNRLLPAAPEGWAEWVAWITKPIPVYRNPSGVSRTGFSFSVENRSSPAEFPAHIEKGAYENLLFGLFGGFGGDVYPVCGSLLGPEAGSFGENKNRSR